MKHALEDCELLRLPESPRLKLTWNFEYTYFFLDAALEDRVCSCSNAFLNDKCFDGTPSADSTIRCMTSKTGVVFRLTDLSHNFDNPSTSSTSPKSPTGFTGKPKDPKWLPRNSVVSNSRSSGEIPCQSVLNTNSTGEGDRTPAFKPSVGPLRMIKRLCWNLTVIKKAYAECCDKGEQLELKAAGEFRLSDVEQYSASFIPRIDLAACKL